MWEIFTCGKMPYGRLKNTEVVERVQRGIILERPKSCAKEIYDVSANYVKIPEQDLVLNIGFRVVFVPTGDEGVLGARTRRTTRLPYSQRSAGVGRPGTDRLDGRSVTQPHNGRRTENHQFKSKQNIAAMQHYI